MILVNGWWMPHKGDHFVVRANEFLTKAGYQSQQRKLSLKNLPNKRIALDVGAHVGLWSKDLVQHFEKVIAFEPITEHRECLKKNVIAENLDIRSVALGEFIGKTDFKYYMENSGKTHRIEGENYEIVTIDSLNLNDVDYIKIDVEGFEKQVIMGAHETIQRCHPRIIIEIKKLQHLGQGQELDAQNHLLNIGYKKISFFGADHIFDWAG